MSKTDKEREIVELLMQRGYISVSELSELLFISESSVRRYLASLETKRLVKRSYGGAELIKSASLAAPFAIRAKQNIPAKKVMAKKAAALVRDKDIVFLDQSSSSFFVAAELMRRSSLTVITNNPEIMVLLSNSDVEVISSGGQLSRENRNCLLGDDANRIFSQVRANILFFSTKSLSKDGILYDCIREEVCIRNTMIANAEKKVFLCDSEKINTFAGFKQCTLKDVDYLICENNKAQIFKKHFDNLIIK